MDKILTKIKTVSLYGVIFLLPLFFLPATQEFYTTAKFYFLVFAILWILVISVVSVGINKKMRFRYSALTGLVGLFIIAYGLSLVISSPNKIGALIALPAGFGPVLALGLLYVLAMQSRLRRLLLTLDISALIVGVGAVVFGLLPFQNLILPAGVQFLKNPQFTPLGTTLDRTLFLGFFFLHQLSHVVSIDIKKISHAARWSVFFIISAISLFISLYLIVSDKSVLPRLAPYRTSWYAAVDTLKNPRTAIIGVGLDNFESMFTRAKVPSYNDTPVWEMNFNQGRSFVFHLMTETGVLGLMTFFLIFGAVFKRLAIRERVLMLYLLAVFFLLPPSFIMLFLFFMLMVIAEESHKNARSVNVNFDAPAPLPLYAFIVCALIVIFMTGYWAGRAYFAEHAFKQAVDAILRNRLSVGYTDMRRAVLLNPFTERFRSSFAQLHVAIVYNIVGSKKAEKISKEDSQDMALAVKTAISEAQAATGLNGEKADHWGKLAGVYEAFSGLAQGADQMASVSYERALMADSINPNLYFRLGSIYYRGKNFPRAADFFTQAARLKPDWANAQYNLAWSLFQKKDYETAVSVMENVLTLVKAKSPDFQRAIADLDEFRKKLPKEEKQESLPQETKSEQGGLSLPDMPTPDMPTPTPAS